MYRRIAPWWRVKNKDEESLSMKTLFLETITRDQARDTGMAMVLLCLLTAAFSHKEAYTILAIVLLIIDMAWPGFFGPLAKIWLAAANLAGTMTSSVILSLLYFLIVTPVGMVRRLAGFDSLQIKEWKKGSSSVFRVRNHTYVGKDMEKPY